jgi:hypothetical protein
MAVAAPAAAAPAAEFAKEAHGFQLVQQQFVREYDSHVLLYKHKKTGAQQLACTTCIAHAQRSATAEKAHVGLAGGCCQLQLRTQSMHANPSFSSSLLL